MRNFITWIMPKSTAGQVIAILAGSFIILLSSFAYEEIQETDNRELEWALSGRTQGRLAAMKPILDNMIGDQHENLFQLTASCFSGYSITDAPLSHYGKADDTDALKLTIADTLNVNPNDVRAGRARIRLKDFSHGKCSNPEADETADGIIVSIKLKSGKWLNAEVHHHWHFRYMARWLQRTGGWFLFVGIVAIFFIRRITRPLQNLTDAAVQFGDGLKVSPIKEQGPPDLRRAVRAFNDMQQQVADEITKRTNTLASISHDVRTPLTALRLKAELIEDVDVRQDLISSVDKMERITASALEFLRGESRTEPKRCVDLGVLLESECSDFEDMGQPVTYNGALSAEVICRPDALARAVRNLIENAVKYGEQAKVDLLITQEAALISITDIGPGIPQDKIAQAMEPFERLSKARESNQGGFGLGLSVAKAIAEGHDGHLILTENDPTGLIATIQIPLK